MSRALLRRDTKWSPIAMLNRESRAGDFVLSCSVMQTAEGWLSGAVETKVVEGQASVVASVEKAFAEHSHKALGVFPELRQALKACESFAKEWAKTKFEDAPIEPCGCREISS